MNQRAVERAYHVKPYPLGIFGLHLQMHALEGMAGKLPAGVQALDHLVEDGALAHAVDAAEDVHLTVEIPHDMVAAAPQRVDFYLSDVVCVFLHKRC